MTRRIAGVELGGTKSIAILAEGNTILDRLRVPTTRPDETLAALAAQADAWHAAAPLAAIGIGSFGPLVLDRDDPSFGHIGLTPKPHWSNANIVGAFAALGVPVGFDTDVGGAALAEGLWGASRGCTDYVYLTIGTGIGAGIVAGGKLVHGAAHPEVGHLRVRRRSGDGFAGSCPFHGDCLEGLVSGPSLFARTGIDGASIGDENPVWADVVNEIAEAMMILVLALAPQRIVIGGGVASMRPLLLPQVRDRTATILAGYQGYTPDSVSRLIVAPRLGDNAGPRGALALAVAALADE